MKIAISFCLLVISITAHSQNVYGEAFEVKQPIKSFSSEALPTGQTQLTGTIENTCAMKGCWMNVVMENGEKMRVTFKDYGFFVPTGGVEGESTIVNGTLSKTEVSVEALKHYAKDAGKSEEEIAKITAPKVEYAFIADGVIIGDQTQD